jgi:hypothetical protein
LKFWILISKFGCLNLGAVESDEIRWIPPVIVTCYTPLWGLWRFMEGCRMEAEPPLAVTWWFNVGIKFVCRHPPLNIWILVSSIYIYSKTLWKNVRKCMLWKILKPNGKNIRTLFSTWMSMMFLLKKTMEKKERKKHILVSTLSHRNLLWKTLRVKLTLEKECNVMFDSGYFKMMPPWIL